MSREKKLERGMVQVYTGDGKGKTTAALGQAFRSIGHDLKVCAIMFMKGNIEYGELSTAKRLFPNILIHEMGRESFVSKANPAREDIEWAKRGLQLAQEVLIADEHDLVILDEINVAIDFGLLETKDVLALIEMKSSSTELILTGRYAPPEILQVADLATEMKCIKHYYDQGIPARLGIER